MKLISSTWKPQSPVEEVVNGITHGLAALLAVPATVLMIFRAAHVGEVRGVVAVSVYGFTLFLLYAVSTVYHVLPISRGKAWLRVFDHAAIYLLIAGTYTPFTLVALRGGWGWSLFGVIWGLALAGVCFKILFIHRFRILSVIIYIAMGWLVLIAIRPLMRQLPERTLLLLLAGGIAYTGGIVFYASRRCPFNHGIWHLFVVAGSVLHCLAVLTLFPPGPIS